MAGGRRGNRMPASCAKPRIPDQSILSRHDRDKLASPLLPSVFPPARGTVHTIALDYGAEQPLVLESPAGSVQSFVPPSGVTAAEARRLVAAAVAGPSDGPPLAAHVVPGDRVVIAVAGDVPQGQAVVDAVRDCLLNAGIGLGDVVVLEGPALGYGSSTRATLPTIAGAEVFDPSVESATSYLAADGAGRPLHLARPLVDADVVIAVGEWGWSPAFSGRSTEGELWPTFAREACRRDLLKSLARRGRNALGDWKVCMQDIAWQLGVCASLRLVRGSQGGLLAARFGLPDVASRQCREAAAVWRPAFDVPADLAVVSLSDPGGGFEAIVAAVAAAARVTLAGGTICVACGSVAPPGVILTRWRQGASLEGLVHEAVASGDATLIADALLTRLFARAIDDRRLVLLSDLDEGIVEDLEFGHAAAVDSVQRLARRCDRLAVLAEADRSFPQMDPRFSDSA